MGPGPLQAILVILPFQAILVILPFLIILLRASNVAGNSCNITGDAQKYWATILVSPSDTDRTTPPAALRREQPPPHLSPPN